MQPYFRDRKISARLVGICGRCENTFPITLKKRKDYPMRVCPKCKAENRFDIVWKK
jgi:NAD-dependent SIR2 family protein deacetylase